MLALRNLGNLFFVSPQQSTINSQQSTINNQQALAHNPLFVYAL
ncbi:MULTISPECIES: hypothetical protein [unclassified Calothrix]|nr:MULTISPECIES: hypothetical protein [unclassified Calothrix]